MPDDRLKRLREALSDRYRIDRLVGEGGMATVYLAEDLRHDRRVAVKVLKPELAAMVGADRFLSEIRTTAALHHPHILQLFDSGQADGLLFYVMPHVEGESLRERLERERQLPIDEAVDLATKVARALDHAHRAGVVHRDVKPGNILLSDGEPLVADFGIALIAGAGEGGRMTETGLSLGTPHYMAPEQATGDQPVGPAADVYSLGCVLYECLVGQPPFKGNTVHAVLGSILTSEPPRVTDGRATVPPNVASAISTALEKVPADRFRGPLEFAAALADPGYRDHAGTAVVGGDGAGKWRAATAVASVVAVGAVIAAALSLSQPATVGPHFQVPVAFRDEEALAGAGHFDLSADGSTLVYQGVAEAGATQLWVRRSDAVDASPIPGTGGLAPRVVPDISISPDGDEVVFYRAGSFYVVPVSGGTPREVADSIWGSARWSPDGEWIYTRRLPWPGLVRVPARGGAPEIVTRPDTARGETGHVWAEVLPDGVVLFEARGAEGPWIKGFRRDPGETVAIVEGRYPRYANGRLLFMSPDGSSILSAPFDPGTLRTTGNPEVVVDGLPARGSSLAGAFGYAVSQNGVLAYAPRTRWQMNWVTRTGARRPVDPGWILDDQPGPWALSPDGERVALRVGPSGSGDIWMKELDRGPETRVTSLPGEERPAGWLDNETLLVLSQGETGLDLYAVRADGAGELRPVYDHDSGIAGATVSPEGDWVVFSTDIREFTAAGPVGGDLFAFQPGLDDEARLVLQTDGYVAGGATLAPGARLLAYQASPTRRTEVMLRPFPDIDSGRIQVSVAGGSSPHWDRDGSRLYYLDEQWKMIEVEVLQGPVPKVVRRTLFEVDHSFSSGYELAPDGSFLMMRSEPELVLVFDWLKLVE